MTKKSVKRVPIKIGFTMKMKLKLRELQYLDKDEEVLQLSQYYDILTASVLNKPVYNSLYVTGNPKNHKNWIHFESVWEICRMKDWDRNLYLEAQFKRAESWEKMKRPYPSMLYSIGALKYFTSYLSVIKQKHSKDMNASRKQTGSKVGSRKTQVIDAIVYSASVLSNAMELSKHKDLEQYKVLKIYQSWSELSPYYLWSVPWFRDITSELEGTKTEELRETFKMIQKSPMLIELIDKTVESVERAYGLPQNTSL